MKLFILLIFLIVTSCSSTETDSERLSKLKYMGIADGLGCSNQNGTTLKERICLNLKFQKVDSIINQLLDSLHSVLPTAKYTILKDDQEKWIISRRKQSEKASEGFRGHMLGIFYLQKMINLTEERIEYLYRYHNSKQ